MTVTETSKQTLSFRELEVGDPAPWFIQRTGSHPNFNFSNMGGFYVLLAFFVSAGDQAGQAALRFVEARRQQFDDKKLLFFGVSLDQRDESQGRVKDQIPGIRFFWDFDGSASREYGAIPLDAKLGQGQVPIARKWVLLDPMLRVRAVVPFQENGAEQAELGRLLDALPPLEEDAGVALQAPVLMLPRVFEPELCQELVALYEEHGGEESGFMREVDGKTVKLHDHSIKRRSDYLIEDEALRRRLNERIHRRLVTPIERAFQFKASRMERYNIACYESTSRGHFMPHRDNTTKGTAHRRFAVSVNLNDDFEGGELRFREFGPRWYRPPAGGALVFSCSILHEVAPMRRGKRYVFLPFLYDDAAAEIREANNKHLDESLTAYKKSD
ncbi:MAG: 2OG-Fe(II) oxygenase [Pseudomonadota bacterium]